MTSPDQNYTSWHTGMKVVAIHDHQHARAEGFRIEAGKVYELTRIFVCPVEHRVGVYLAGIHLPDWRPGEPYGWYVEHFRPVQTRKTDISIFTAMLSPKPAKAGKVRA